MTVETAGDGRGGNMSAAGEPYFQANLFGCVM